MGFQWLVFLRGFMVAVRPLFLPTPTSEPVGKACGWLAPEDPSVQGQLAQFMAMVLALTGLLRPVLVEGQVVVVLLVLLLVVLVLMCLAGS